MALDYSKWDALELSDDSDIEVHPNVDKKSFIRAKQSQIHQEREHRKHQIVTLKHERIINDGLITRIDALLNALKAHSDSTDSPDEIVFRSLIESAGDPAEDQPPAPPPGVHTEVKDKPTYSKMMAALVDEVKTQVDKAQPIDRLEAFTGEVDKHRHRVLDLQQQLLAKLAELEKQEKSKITSDSIHFGFNSSHVAKAKDIKPASSSSPPKRESVQLVNSPSASSTPTSSRRDSSPQDEPIDSGAEADAEDTDGLASDTSVRRATALGKKFGAIKAQDYRASLQFISQNPSVLAERETDGLLLQAFDEQTAGNSDLARQCVHQALLLQYCRALGRDGVALFFKRITTKDHQARKVFFDDVNSTYARLRDRADELARETATEEDEPAGVEQIQLHAVNPGQKIQIAVPSRDLPADAEARKIFDSFPPGLQRALETGELDELNKVLGKMSVEVAEEVVSQLGQGGMLSLEQGIIDATTEQGRTQMEEIEKTGKMPEAMANARLELAGEPAGEPGPVLVDEDMD